MRTVTEPFKAGAMRAARAFFLVGLTMAGSSGFAAQSRYTGDEMPGRFMPGAYFAFKADFYIRKQDFGEALEMAQLASYWGDKGAQYEVGILYSTGTGVAADKALGAAWLRLAATRSNPQAVGALARAMADLAPEQVQDAERIWQELQARYADEVTLARARRHFEEERRNVTGSRVGFMSSLKMIVGGPLGDDRDLGDNYYATQQKQFDQFVEKNFGHGHVEVGPIQADHSENHASAVQP